MRLVKYIFGFVILLFIGYSFGWYYAASRITKEVNMLYSGHEFPMLNTNQQNIHVSFVKATSSGFPFEMAISLHGFKEEGREAVISYNNPINIGYNLLSQNIYVSYNGEIDSTYKPIIRGFGAKLKIKDYLIKTSVTLQNIINIIIEGADPAEILNHIKAIYISTSKVQIFDKQEEELFYDKNYEKLKITFVPAKYYRQIDDFINNIPQEYTINYLIKTKPVKFAARKIPVSLFYGFSMLPSDFKASMQVSIKTKAKTFPNFAKNLEVQATGNMSANKIDVSSIMLDFKTGNVKANKNIQLLSEIKFSIKDGLFDDFFKKYDSVKQQILSLPGGFVLNQEMIYIIANKEAFRFKDLENSDYELKVDFNSKVNSVNMSSVVKLNNFSIYSGDSGFKLSNDSIIKLASKNWRSQGVLLLKNYPKIVDFSSGYIYRFGKFRFLNDKARKLYVKVNKDFLKKISDYPDSTSNDLSFEYNIDSKNITASKIGNIKISQMFELYQLTLYQKLFGDIDPHGNILKQMKKTLPNLDENDPTLRKLLPAIIGKDIEEIIPENVKDIQEEIKNIVPKKEELKKPLKKLLKNFVK